MGSVFSTRIYIQKFCPTESSPNLTWFEQLKNIQSDLIFPKCCFFPHFSDWQTLNASTLVYVHLCRVFTLVYLSISKIAPCHESIGTSPVTFWAIYSHKLLSSDTNHIKTCFRIVNLMTNFDCIDYGLLFDESIQQKLSLVDLRLKWSIHNYEKIHVGTKRTNRKSRKIQKKYARSQVHVVRSNRWKNVHRAMGTTLGYKNLVSMLSHILHARIKKKIDWTGI